MKKEAFNQLINFFWTSASFAPVVYFWVGKNTTFLYFFIAISVVFSLLPGRLFQLSSYGRFYERFGVRFIRNFVQNGTFINRTARKQDESHKVIRDRRQARRYLSTIQMYERYHLSCFVFFGLTIIYAAVRHYYLSALLILAANIIYNVYPILLQQYNKLRVMRVLR